MTQTRRTDIRDVGEKRIIREFIKPLFNAEDDPAGVGDDCAMIEFGSDVALVSTDRVPADLTAFRLGILDYSALGDYLARLNLSDIAACGGRPRGLLLNLGLPDSIAFEDVQQLCHGFGACALRHGTRVLGGDITHSVELSISATSIGSVAKAKVLTRRGARAGDSIFISRPIGMTPTAFRSFLGGVGDKLSSSEQEQLKEQFTQMEPMFALGQKLSDSGICSACMDNTDGTGQSLNELSEASGCAFVVEERALTISPVINKVCQIFNTKAVDMIFDGGADFSLIGTLRGNWTSESGSERIGYPIEIIGHTSAELSPGVWLLSDKIEPLRFKGWNYFLSSAAKLP